MNTSNTRSIDKAIREAGIANVTLRGGNGYQYLAFDNGTNFDTRSVYVFRVCDLTVEQWVDEARAFAGEMA